MFLLSSIDFLVRATLSLVYLLTGRSFGSAHRPYDPALDHNRNAYGFNLSSLLSLGWGTLVVRLALFAAIALKRAKKKVIAHRHFKFFIRSLVRLQSYIMLDLLLAPIVRVSCALVMAYLIVAYVHLACQLVPFAKLLFGWLSVGAFFYLLISGFVYFTNKLAYSSNVDVIQRFWKRSFSIFWLIESGLFAFFVYMTLNASSEVWAAYDTPSLFKTQFFSLRMLFVRLSLISLAILFTSFLVSLAAKQQAAGELIIQMAVTSLIVLSLWIETYQFYLFVLCAPSYGWVFNVEIHESFIEADARRNRLLRNFVFICGVVKFWHFLFIAVNWLFYLNRQLEHSDVRLGLLNASIQNLLILYILNLIAMFPYVKHIIHRGLAKPYFWFLVDEGSNVLYQALELTYTFYSNLIY